MPDSFDPAKKSLPKAKPLSTNPPAARPEPAKPTSAAPQAKSPTHALPSHGPSSVAGKPAKPVGARPPATKGPFAPIPTIQLGAAAPRSSSASYHGALARPAKERPTWLFPALFGGLAVTAVVGVVLVVALRGDKEPKVATGKKKSPVATDSSAMADKGAKGTVVPADAKASAKKEADPPKTEPATAREADSPKKSETTPAAPEPTDEEEKPTDEKTPAADAEQPQENPFKPPTDKPAEDEVVDGPEPDAAITKGADQEMTRKDLIRTFKPSVVLINVKGERGEGLGSGFVVDKQGTVMTNYHVVEGCQSANVEFSDGFTTEVLGFLAYDMGKDLAMIRINCPADRLRPAAVSPTLPEQGEEVATFGAPRGVKFTTTDGSVSAVRSGNELKPIFERMYGFDMYTQMGYDPNATWIQITAAITHGNSGGPLTNMKGEVIGVNTWGFGEKGEALNFSGSSLGVLELMKKRNVKLKGFDQLPKPREGRVRPDGTRDKNAADLPAEIAANRAVGEVHILKDHKGPVLDMALSPSGRYLATASADKSVIVVDLPAMKVLHKHEADVEKFTSVAFTHDEQALLAGNTAGGGEPAAIHAWHVVSGQSLRRFTTRTEGPRSICMSPDEMYFITTHDAGTAELRIFLPLEWRKEMKSADTGSPCYGAAFSPNGDHCVLAGGGGTINMWSFANQEIKPVAQGVRAHSGEIYSVAFSPNGKFLASAGKDGAIRIWSNWQTANQWKLEKELKASNDAIARAAWSPDGKMIVGAGADKQVRVWDVEKKESKHIFKGHTGPLSAVVFLRGGKHVVSSSHDGTIRIWNIDGNKGAGPSDTAVAGVRPRISRKAQEKVPATDKIETATKQLKDIFKEQYSAAKKIDERQKLALTIFKQAGAEKNSPVERYAMLSEALRMAIESGAVAVALDATDEISAWFEVEPVKLQAETVEKAAARLRADPDKVKLGAVALQWAIEAFNEDHYSEAARMIKVAHEMAAKGKNSDLVKQVNKRKGEIQQGKAIWDAYIAALATLKSKADDADANLVAGKYLCFINGDWTKGLAHLAKGTDAELKALATRDLAAPTKVDDRIALADSWQKLSKSVEPNYRPSMLAAAQFWYKKALPDLTGLPKLKVETELKKLGDIPTARQRR